MPRRGEPPTSPRQTGTRLPETEPQIPSGRVGHPVHVFISSHHRVPSGYSCFVPTPRVRLELRPCLLGCPDRNLPFLYPSISSGVGVKDLKSGCTFLGDTGPDTGSGGLYLAPRPVLSRPPGSPPPHRPPRAVLRRCPPPTSVSCHSCRPLLPGDRDTGRARAVTILGRSHDLRRPSSSDDGPGSTSSRGKSMVLFARSPHPESGEDVESQ